MINEADMNTTNTHTTEDLMTIKTLRDLLAQLTYEGESLKAIDNEAAVKRFNKATDAILVALNDLEDTVRRAAL